MGLWQDIYLFRKTLILILSPILLLPLLIVPEADFFSQSACAYTIILMAIYWVSEVVPLAVTALLPLVLYPFLGVLPAREVSVQYLKDVNILFLGGLTVAVAVEHWNLHKRIALKVLTFVGTKPKWLLFGFMSTTAFLSMWISNVATTAMMIPIAQAVLTEMNTESGKEDSDSGCNTPEDEIPHEQEYKEDNIMMRTALTSEMGNIGEAQELGARLASHDQQQVPQWAQTPTRINDVTVRYSKGAMYDQVLNDDSRNLSQDMFTMSLPFVQKQTPQINLTVPADEDGPDTSTTQLVPMNVSVTLDDYEMDKKKKREQKMKGMCKALTICVCYSANIGGTATLTGTGPNLIMAGQFRTMYEDAPEVDFGSWVMYAFPGMMIFLVFTWLWLQYLFLGMTLKEIFTCCGDRSKSQEEVQAERVIRRQYRDLGPICFAEVFVLVLFTLLALLWLTREPGFIPGWGTLPFFKTKYITDATVAMFISFLLFICPSRRPNIFCLRAPGPRERGPVPPILTWSIVQQKMAWNVIILLGGSFAMALGSKESGLSKWIGIKLSPLSGLHPALASLICCFVICALTQCTSNTATATVFIPILAELAEILHVNPLYLLLPATVITSYAFMLPVSTPPNAIAYSYGHLKMKDMIKAGSLLNLIGIIIAISTVFIMGGVSFQVHENCPYWLHSDFCNATRFNETMLNFTSTQLPNATLS